MNLTRKGLTFFGLLLGICLPCICPVRAQSSARLKGIVLDAGGGPVPGADVTLFSDERVLATKANNKGEFEFVPLPSGVRYLEARSNGFRTVGILVPDTIPELVSLPPLWPGEGGGPCGLPYDLPPPVSYEKKVGDVQLTGTINDAYGRPLASSSLTLTRADLNTPLSTGEGLKRLFKQTPAAQSLASDAGEFQFTDLDPGWYRLIVSHPPVYGDHAVDFWVARETLTRLLPIYLVPKGMFTCTVPVPFPPPPP